MSRAVLTSSLAIAIGILITECLGCLCPRFLDVSVPEPFPDEFKEFKSAEKRGGGEELGVLERVLFFASAWLDAYVIGGGWLTFKVAAKWATWQHITKIPETLEGEEDKKYMHARRRLSSRLLGRFLNGTLYNIFCAGVGWLCSKALFLWIGSLPEHLWYLTVAGVVVAFLVVFVRLFYYEATTKKLKPFTEKLGAQQRG
jgi:hypothetical protein